MSLSAAGQRGSFWAVWAFIVRLNDVAWQLFRATSNLLLLQAVTLAFRVWSRLIPAETECQCHRQIRRRGLCMQPAAMCFSVMVRPDDSQTGHSVTQLAAEVEDCLGPRNTHLKTRQERVSNHQNITKHSCLRVKRMFFSKHRKQSGELDFTTAEERQCFFLKSDKRSY